ncbi:MAG: DNA-binding protein WhiA [Oscillospiraceae bacterium]|nr:DNA-binding protein WhiA [Oscillospiraceae bacterium]
MTVAATPQSFSAGVKAELCREIPAKRCCAVAEIYGILLFCNTFSDTTVRIVTESRDFAWMLPKLLRKAFAMDFDEFPSMAAPGKLVFQITEPDKIAYLMEVYGFERENTLALHVNLAMLEEECCRTAFLRGAFLAGGSVTDPGKGYHMEMATAHHAVARETHALIGEAMGFEAKIAGRGGSKVLYLKHSDLISDALTFLGAPVSAMGIMEAKLEKELKNKVNRRCNCDDANTSKVVDAAQGQLNAIRILRERKLLDGLPEKLKQAAVAREANPEASLSELAAMMLPPITKPAMNHRLKKLMELAKEPGKEGT